jgi:serine/threonine-protein kinase
MAAYVLPDDRSVVFTVQRQRGGPSPVVGELAVVALDSLAASPMRHTMLGVNGRCAIAYVYGFLLYTGLDGATIMAVRYDAATRKILGAPVAVLREPDGDIDGADLSHDGTLVYTRRNGTNAPVLVGADGARMPLLGHAAGSFMHPRYSPDGRKIALAGLSPQGSDVFIYDVASRTSTRLTTTGNAYLPFWMPDGRRVVFLSTRSGNDAFWAQIADGSSPPEKLVEFPGIFAGTATPDGRALLYQRQDRRVWGIWTAKLEGDRSQHPVLTESFDDYMPALSHDGRWLAYTSNASGREEVYVRSYPASSAPVQISDAGGKEPVWSRDGRRLYYRSGRQLVAATVATEREFAVASRAPMIDDAFDGGMPHANYDAAPDGRGLLVLSSQDKSGPETIVVVNWLAELRAKLAGAP